MCLLRKPLLLCLLLHTLTTTTILAMSINATAADACQQTDGSGSMWGDVNPNIFYVCDNASSNAPVQLQCPEGRGFFNGLGFFGCIPYEQWPACKTAEAEQLQQQRERCSVAPDTMEPWASVNPNKFYICSQQNVQPQLVNCESGKGFISVHTTTPTSGGGGRIVGCTDWAKWRSYMKCTDYY